MFFRIGGPHVGKATVSLEVNSDHVILDDIWAWRADHGNGVGWTVNTADTGVVVNGDNVTATGLFVEHYQKFQVIWNGDDGTDDLLPERDAVRRADPGRLDVQPDGTMGYAAVLVSPTGAHFTGYGMGTLQLLQPRRGHLRRARLRGAQPGRRSRCTTCSPSSWIPPTARAASSTSSTTPAAPRRSPTRTFR